MVIVTTATEAEKTGRNSSIECKTSYKVPTRAMTATLTKRCHVKIVPVVSGPSSSLFTNTSLTCSSQEGYTARRYDCDKATSSARGGGS